ncbi:hypothetical protein B9Z07_25195 [Burkholderia cenocepacia]|uniref:Uncharacterized protein n=1 Tax=Burkholderia cenocepacia TaxID=95486 RepID=A0AAD0NFJ3_9BURK|nr:hypothetical protein B9Z07_25195 [Burkholderia cenocepacia]PRE33245.1 hypothetical protein C6P63_29895 [Burkholderia cenocepacia]RQU74338.1 hypothetical protein DF049_25350 [Burkholderia cenocepacia]RQU98212.1 hypothetical protein DF042_25400 [Burkholderia cenocepacia]
MFAWRCILRSIADARFEAYRQGTIHIGSGSSCGRARMLTVEIHSAASRFCRRISTRARASSLLPPCAPVGQEQRSCGIGSRTAAFRRPSRRSPAHAHH